MHAYSIDKRIRNSVSVTLFIISYSMSLLLQAKLSPLLEKLSTQLATWGMGEIVEFISATGMLPNILEAAVIYAMVTYVFERWIWKWPGFRTILGIPNLNGHWEGTLQSSFTEEPIPMKIDITQTWSNISFKSTFPHSTSSSNTAAIHVDESRGISIYFGFHNDSNDIGTGMQSYDGYNILTLQDQNTLTARYFNNRPNPKKQIKGGNMGTFNVVRKK